MIINILKKMYKRMKFNKYSLLGKNFKCSKDSNCINYSYSKRNIQIGSNCEINGTLIVSRNGNLKIGNYTTIRYNSKITCACNITIGNYVIISNNVAIYDNNSHPTSPNYRKQMCISGFESEMWNFERAKSKDVVIKDNVWIGEGVTILKGVTIGEGAIIGTKSVVSKDVKPYTIVGGNPAILLKRIEEE